MALTTAMPAIAAALDGLSLFALAFGGLQAASVVGMVLAGRSCDRHGPQPATVAGLVLFGAGLLLAGLAPAMGWLVAGRVVQGLGTGMLGVALYVGMGRLLPGALHPRLFAAMAAAWVLPGLVGPLAAAWVVQQAGWRWVFLGVALAILPTAAGLLPAFGRLARPEPEVTTGATTVATGAAPLAWAALAMGSALLLHGAGTGAAWLPHGPALALGLLGAGLAATRLLPTGSLRAAPGLPAVIALRGLLAAAFATAEVFVPLALVRLQGWSLAQAGLVLSTGAVLWSLGSALQARIQAPARRRLALQLGLLAVAAGIGGMAVALLPGPPSWLPPGWGPAAWVVAAWALAGFGIGLGFPMLSVLTLALSPPAVQGRNASALQLADALGCSAALALAGALFNAAGHQGALGHGLPLGLAIVLALLGAALARRAFA
jgi:MFS family permease